MIFVTGDTHGDFYRFSLEEFPEQKEMTRDDTMIICGDFGGVWCGDERDNEELVAQILELEEQLQQRKDRADTLRVYLRNIEATEELQEFDPRIWLEIVEKATIYHDKRIVFTFQDGKEVASYFWEVT